MKICYLLSSGYMHTDGRISKVNQMKKPTGAILQLLFLKVHKDRFGRTFLHARMHTHTL
jgi:hypothetical protein